MGICYVWNDMFWWWDKSTLAMEILIVRKFFIGRDVSFDLNQLLK